MTGDETAVLARRAASGDDQAWSTLVKQYSGLVFSVARSYQLTDAQVADVVQTTWLRCVQHIGRIRDPRKVAGWLVTTARRECISVIRADARERPLRDNEDDLSAVEPPETMVLRYERQALVRAALERLPERQRQLLSLLVASPPLSYDEISSLLSMPVGSIGPTRARALQRLRTLLEAAESDVA